MMQYELDVRIDMTSILTKENLSNPNSYVIRFTSLSNWSKIVFCQTNYTHI